MIENTKTYYAPMHTAEHILNQTMIRLFNCGRSVTHHIEKKKSKCDYRFDRDLTPDDVQNIEKQINEIIRSNAQVSDLILSATEASKQFTLDRIPEGENIRIVRIGDYDVCACSGNHVQNTSEIGAFRIISHQFENGILRIRFKLDDSIHGNSGNLS